LNTLRPAPALQFTTLASWEVLPQEAQAHVTKKKKGVTCSVLLWGSVQGFGSGKNEQQAAESDCWRCCGLLACVWCTV